MNKTIFGYTLIIILLLITAFISLNLFFRQQSEHDNLDIRMFPYTMDDWKGKDLNITEKEYKILETRNLVSRKYSNSADENLYLFIIYSETNRRVIHPPEVCFIGSGVKITDKKTELINKGRKSFLSNKLYLGKGDKKEIALYCYKAGNFYTENYYLQQIHFTLNQLLGKRRGGATIRVSMPLSESEEETVETLKRFMKKVIMRLEELS